MATTLRFTSSTLADVKAQRVYWKIRWQDPWTLVSPKLWCNAAQWTAAPSLPVAELHWRYGIALELGAQQFAARFKETNRLRQYVKVEYDTFPVDAAATDPLRWFGTIEIEIDDFHGAVQRAVGGDTIAFASGKNHFTAMGLEWLLDNAYVTTSVVAQAGGVARVNRALEFNPEGRGNMSPVPGPDGVYVFASSLEGAVTWSSYAIANYLLAYHTPKDFNGQQMLKFELGGFSLGVLCPVDAPSIAPQDKSVRELLNILLPRQRAAGWNLVPGDAPGSTIVVNVFSLSGTEIPLDLLAFPWNIPANPLQFVIVPERDRGNEVAIKRSTADAFDQVTVRGARRTSTATFSFYDGTLGIGWAPALETAFELGASAAADYPAAAEVDARQYRNEMARAADKFQRVYQRFIIPANFQGNVGDGISGVPAAPLAPKDADPTQPSVLAPEDLRFAAHLALQEDFDYTALPATELTEPPHRPLRPLVLYPRSDSTALAPRFRHIDAIGLGEQQPESVEFGDVWSAHVRVDADDGALWIELQGALPQDLAASDFSRLTEDPDPALTGSADFRKLLATLSVEWSEYASVTYPAAGPAGLDTLRIFTVQAGPAYRLDYLCPQTVVGLEPGTAELLRCAAGGFLRDDRDQLRAIARTAYAWHSVTRKAVGFQTALLNSSLPIGSFLVSLGDPAVAGDVHTEDLNSVVTAIEVRSPSAEGTGQVEPPVPQIRYETSFGELDPLQLL